MTATTAACVVSLPTTCVNDTVVCIATGPSLTAEDVNAVRGKASVIVVNDAHRLAPWADILYSSDRYWWAHYKGVPAFTGLKVAIEHTPGRHATWYGPDLIVLKHTGYRGVDFSRDGLRTCANNSGGAALNLAVHLNPTRIVLLGYDMGSTQGKTHFFGQHPSPLSNQHNYPTWRTAFNQMAPPLAERGIEVINCTPQTSLDAFPVADLRDVLPPVAERLAS